jgi:site-specific recombinase XerC
MLGHRRGQPPRNKGMRYPADPPTVEEIVLVMRYAGDRPHGLRLRGLIVVMWRAGLRISETLALTESDLDSDHGAILVRHGKGNKRREVGMDHWGWDLLEALHGIYSHALRVVPAAVRLAGGLDMWEREAAAQVNHMTSEMSRRG